MTQEQINEIKKAHPGPFAQKRAAGLSEQQAAAAIQAQIEHDAKHTPASIALAVAIAACDLFRITYERALSAYREAQTARAKALEEDPEAQLPELLAMEDPEVQAKLKEAQLSIESLTATLGLRGERCRQLEEELKEAMAASAKLRTEHEASLALKDARILDLEGQIQTANANAAESIEQLKGMNTRMDSIVAADAAQKERITQLEADLKASQEALQKVQIQTAAKKK